MSCLWRESVLAHLNLYYLVELTLNTWKLFQIDYAKYYCGLYVGHFHQNAWKVIVNTLDVKPANLFLSFRKLMDLRKKCIMKRIFTHPIPTIEIRDKQYEWGWCDGFSTWLTNFERMLDCTWPRFVMYQYQHKIVL